MMDGACVAAWSKTQQTVSLCSSEAEYCAIAHATCEVTWAKFFSEDLGYAANVPRIWADSAGAIGMTREEIRSKVEHLDLTFYFPRDRVPKSEIALQYVNTVNDVADVMTKHAPLSVLRALLPSMINDLL